MVARSSHAIIVGGGIAGLTAAYRLSQLRATTAAPLRITLVEAADRPGGKILTEHPDDLLIEAGPDSFLAQKPAARELCEELGLADRVIGTNEHGGGTFILRDGRLEPLPEGITMLVPTKLRPLLDSRLISLPGKLRMGLDLVVPPRRDAADESIGAFVRRRLGREAYERMAQPLLSGIYAGDAEQLSLLATFPRLREVEQRHGSLIRGMLAQRQAASSNPGQRARSPFLSLRCGMGELVNALVHRLDGVDLRLGCPAGRVERREAGGYRMHLSGGEVLDGDALLLATPAYVSAALTEDIAPELATLLRGIPYVSTATISLAYRTADVGSIGAGRGFVIPRVENKELTAVTWVSNKFPGRAPAGRVLLRGFVGRAGREGVVELPDDLLLRLVRQELREILGLTAEPVLTHIHRWPDALPQYVLGHLDRLAAIDRVLAGRPGLLLLGAAYRGVGLPDCIQSGTNAAEQAAATMGFLNHARPSTV